MGLGIGVYFDQQVDKAEVLRALCASYDKVWDGLCRLPLLPRQAPDKAKLAAYFAWCDFSAWLRRPTYLVFDFSAAATCMFLRFRLGSHDLAVEIGRWQDRRPRCQRLCWRCSVRVFDDEQHSVFECPAFLIRDMSGSICSLRVSFKTCIVFCGSRINRESFGSY